MPVASSSVAVIFGGPSPEHDVSILTGLLTCHELLVGRPRSEVVGLYWSKNGAFFEVDAALEASAFIDGVPASAAPVALTLGPDGGFSRRKGRLGGGREVLSVGAAIVCCHGSPGEDGSLQGALDLAGIAYAGPSAMGAALGMDKLATAGLLKAAGVSVLPRLLVTPESDEPGFPGPFILKPRFGGSSIGIEVVRDFATAKARVAVSVHLRRGAVLEPYREDLYDLQIAVRSWPQLELSAIERPVRLRAGAEILDYSDKYVGGDGMHAAARELPARVSDEVASQLRHDARIAAAVMGVRGVARIDFLSDGRELYLNELNAIPGSLSRHLFVDPPRTFASLLGDLIAEAKASPAVLYSTVG